VVKAKPSFLVGGIDGFLSKQILARSQHKKYGVSTTPENENTAKKNKSGISLFSFSIQKRARYQPHPKDLQEVIP
jgi:hypothetical protein